LEAGSAAWGKAVGTVDKGASKIFAWLWHGFSNEKRLKHVKVEGRLPKMELSVPNSRSKLEAVGIKMPGAISNRLFAAWWTWRKDNDGTIVLALAPHEGESAQFKPQRLDPI
jgi:hypothetical protein